MIHLRKGEVTDIPAALDLVKQLAIFERAPNEVEVTIEEMENWGFGKDKIFDFFVASNDNKIVGMALYYYKYSTWKGKCLFLEDIIVTESQRGKGIGKLLFEQVVQIAKADKVRRMEWQVLDWNETGLSFYKKYPTHFDGEWINCKFTDKELSEM
ncbi:MAG TPA: GNAT family N-acetyltransferase [Bacteroidia bacterium]